MRSRQTDVVDDENRRGLLGGFEFKSKLLRYRGKE
jgi:hypothetical protein